jgi:AcrR family transcriptional regulator
LNKSQTAAGNGEREDRDSETAPDRRAELLALGRRLFSRHPYDELSIDRIADEAGMAKGLLYYYFGSKRGFYLAVIEQAANDLRRRVEQDASLPADERLARGLDAYLSYVQDSPEAYRALMAGGIGSDPEVRSVVSSERERFLALIVQELAGDASPAPGLRIALEGWFSFIEGACLEWLDRGGLEREALRMLLLHALAGALAAWRAVDPGARVDPAQLGI